ncbi:tetratricopeptide repeat protein [uncultured Campylobacter sp.]|uniref:tetratricopeptide repeat protein n=1 Tax=uncultured Campylobacter sp. TaxID=218934 RepID=UPI00261AE4A3|nr:tetratricopeptide repeat protein [uncultured Campylobacter sp.]
MKKIILALAFLSSFMFAEEAKEPTPEEVISEMEKACENGKGFANENATMKYEETCGMVGAAYENIPELGDLGVKQDLQKAFKFYKKACDGGHALSCFGLGGFYHEGKAVAKDDKKALEFFEKACDTGYESGCTMAAIMRGDAADITNASAQYKKDCDSKDDIFACGLFAVFMEGKDNNEAAKYYKKACELGKNSSDLALQNSPRFNDAVKRYCSRPAELEAQNLRAMQDVIKAKIAEEYRISCDSEGNWVSCAIYASNIESDDQRVAMRYYDKACKLGKKIISIDSNKILQKSCEKAAH